MSSTGGAKALLLVDLSVEQATGGVVSDKMLENIAALTQASCFQLIIDSRLTFNAESTSSLACMYPNIGRVDKNDGAKLHPYIDDIMRNVETPHLHLPKYQYSCFFE